MKNLLTLALTLTLTACGTVDIKHAPPVPKETDIAVATVPAGSTHQVPQQALPVDSLTAADKGNYQKIGDAYDQSIVILKGELSDALTTLHGYQKAPGASTTTAPAATTKKPPL